VSGDLAAGKPLLSSSSASSKQLSSHSLASSNSNISATTGQLTSKKVHEPARKDDLGGRVRAAGDGVNASGPSLVNTGTDDDITKHQTVGNEGGGSSKPNHTSPPRQSGAPLDSSTASPGLSGRLPAERSAGADVCHLGSDRVDKIPRPAPQLPRPPPREIPPPATPPPHSSSACGARRGGPLAAGPPNRRPIPPPPPPLSTVPPVATGHRSGSSCHSR
jgi:hypothetical protein